MKFAVACVVFFVVFPGAVASAHRIDEYLQATILSVEPNGVQASMRLIPGVLVSTSVIGGIDRDGDGNFSESEERAYAQLVLNDLAVSVDGKTVQPKLASWSFPLPAQLRDGLGEIHIDYTVALSPGGQDRSLIIANHHQNAKSVYLMNVLVPREPGVRIAAQKRNAQQSVYELDFGAAPPTSRLDGIQFSSLFHLGMRHIAEGTDHLLFLIVLLLPAPLPVAGMRWGPAASVRQSLLRILGIVTAFTVGHSITLSLAALGAVNVPSRWVEVLIAVSILISAIHAIRPVFPGKEAFIAAFFGLIHGLAFATTLERLGLGHWERVAGILAFNLGIETMQMVVVAAILPSLILLSRTGSYAVFRIGGAVLAGVAATGWVAERVFNIDARIDSVMNAFAQHAPLIAVSLFGLSLLRSRCLLQQVLRRSDPLPVPAKA